MIEKSSWLIFRRKKLNSRLKLKDKKNQIKTMRQKINY